jgi:hypothetical protein
MALGLSIKYLSKWISIEQLPRDIRNSFDFIVDCSHDYW